MQLRSLKILVLLIPLVFSFGCGGGGGGSASVVSGQFISSYVKGLKVCAGKTCTLTDREGKFYFSKLTLPANLSFYIDNVPIGNFTLRENGEIVNPFKIAGEPSVGDKIAKIIHGLANDTTGNLNYLDLSGISVSSNSTFNSLVEAVKNGLSFRLDVNNGSYYVEFNGTDVNLCRDGNCTPVNYRQWLVLVYMMADNNLSPYAYDDLNEMNAVAYTPQVKLVAITDFSDGSDQVAVSNDTTGKLDAVKLNNELDLSSEEALEDFVLKNWNLYPAQHLALIFWDHGDGWRALRTVGLDQSSDSYLFMFRVFKALKNLKEKGISFDLIGFDECLMGTLEVLYDVKDFTKNVVVSEGFEPGEGWDYSKILSFLVENPESNGYALGREIVNSFNQTYGNLSTDNTLTLTLFEKGRIEDIVDNLTDLTAYLNSATFADFKNARENLSTFADASVPCSYCYVDLYEFVNNLNYTEAENVKNLIDGAYKVVIPGSDNENLHGLSIYFPSNSEEAQNSGFDCYRLTENAEAACTVNNVDVSNYFNPFSQTAWDDFLDEFIQLGSGS